MADASRGPRVPIARIGLALGLAIVLMLAWTSQGQDVPEATSQPPKTDSTKPKKGKKDATLPVKITISGPHEAAVNQQLTFQIKVTNTGKEPLSNLTLQAHLDPSLMAGPEALTNQLELPVIGTLEAGETHVIQLRAFARDAGKLGLRVGVDPAPKLLNTAEAVVQVVQGPSGEPIQPPPAFAPAPRSAAPTLPIIEPAPSRPASARHNFTIDPKTPLEKLLPVPPKPEKPAALATDLTQVPELLFEGFDPKAGPPDRHIAHTIAKINHLNKSKTDAFMVALLSKRSDLAGLPFKMGEDCRLKEERGKQFNQALLILRQFMSQGINVTIADAEQAPQRGAEFFWDSYQQHCQQVDRNTRADAKMQEYVTASRIAALTQVCGPQSVHMRRGLVKYLAASSHADATRALAKLAIFTAEDDIRQAAVDALKVRRERDYTDILVQGLRYPLPAVAKRAGEALVKLERKDLVPELVAMLDEADPRAPHAKEIDKKEVTVMRELVKINHHRNCLMCHAPGEPALGGPSGAPMFQRTSSVQRIEGLAKDGSRRTEFVVTEVDEPKTPPPAPPPAPFSEGPSKPAPAPSPEVPQGAIPIPGEPLPSPSTGYQSSHPDILVRVDVTYLRQDFSVMLPVKDAQPWPEMQRFDFVVRNRFLTDKEAETIRTALEKAGPSPYRQVAHAALRGLTGRDAEPNSDAWRRLLRLPTKDSE
jgi:uncharacterized repeat protein (TIGR01451 family)